MNKGKIAELYKQAHREHRQEYFSSDIDPTVKSVSVTRYFDHELFAELLIKECAEKANAIALDIKFDSELDARKYVGDSILKSFGVEE